MIAKKYRFDITPQSAIRVNQGDKVFFRIPRNDLRPAGLKRLLRLERSNKYADDLRAIARSIGFTVPPSGAMIRFFFPCPKSWTKKKKRQLHGMPMLAKPDLDNTLKKFWDSLCIEDKHIAHVEASKQWVYADAGWIEVEIRDYVFPPVPLEIIK
jgi:Holliday junction resolvase RusA-like endonuclease